MPRHGGYKTVPKSQMVYQVCQSPSHHGVGVADCVQLPSCAVVADNLTVNHRAADLVYGASLVWLCLSGRFVA